MRFMFRRFIFLFIIPLVLLGLAQEAQALSVSPLKRQVTLAPGARDFTVPISVRNEEGETKKYSLKVLGAKQLESGAVVYGYGNNSAELWVAPEISTIEIESGKEASVNFLINVPADAAAGTYVLGLAAEIGSNQGGQAVGVAGQVASVLILQVAGVVNELLSVENFRLPTLSIGREWPADIVLKNNGTTELPIRGVISARNWLGQEVYSEEINFGQVLLPQSGRSYNSKINLKDKLILPGLYETELKVAYGLTNQKIYKSESIWYAPIYFWAILLLIVLSVIYKYKFFRH